MTGVIDTRGAFFLALFDAREAFLIQVCDVCPFAFCIGDRASMRPRLIGRGKLFFCGDLPAVLSCFNEATAYWPWKDDWEGDDPQEDGASMRPRLIGRGKAIGRGDDQRGAVASMRPRLIGRGKMATEPSAYRVDSLQ